ncbi:hypothetical protein [Microbacterium hominis]|uniref:Uncharacterized protein n=1 Tax=Microbacterium hominis TaxID=162426 RepID=A0A7D4THC7_9MICO|nr:hypothetical protein [Microbacterium hominis]QKJ19981.1 hypothetical protein HQM25_11850 [Microbacterium hominis]
MRWDRFFDDLEDQLASEWEAERAALDTEAERLRLSRVTLRERLGALIDRVGDGAVTVSLIDGTVLECEVVGVGADWVALAESARPGAVLAPLGAVLGFGMPHADLLRSARPSTSPPSALAERVTFGFALRDLVRRRAEVAVMTTAGRLLAGTIDRAGADHLDLALHEAGAPRRAERITGHRMIPFAAVSFVRATGAVPVF